MVHVNQGKTIVTSYNQLTHTLSISHLLHSLSHVSKSLSPTTHSNSVASGLAKLIYAIGTRSKFDYGTYIFDETVMHGKSHAVKMPIAFPTLICDIILNQHPGICTEADVPKRMESDLSLDYRLFEGTHAADIVAPVAAHNARQPTNILTRDQIIVDLKEVSRIFVIVWPMPCF